MPRLHVNIDHVATVRQARRAAFPDPVEAARICELAGADGITVHLREDRRHIQDHDVQTLRRTVRTLLNLECSLSDAMVEIACGIRPDEVCIVPENRQEVTTEGGLDAVTELPRLKRVVARLTAAGILVSVFVDPDLPQLVASRDAGAQFVELHTGNYAHACAAGLPATNETARLELARLEAAARHASSIGLRVNAGHGLDYQNVQPVARLARIEELNIGFAIVARSIFTGLDRAVRDMIDAMRESAA